jgi:hypothetical protein
MEAFSLAFTRRCIFSNGLKSVATGWVGAAPLASEFNLC